MSLASRRRVLTLAGGILAAIYLPACSLFRKRAEAICANDPAISDEHTPLTIDVHAHVFNASDLQVRRFFELIAGRQDDSLGRVTRALGGVLQDLGWSLAPTAAQELQMLRRLEPILGGCDTGEQVRSLANMRDHAYQTAKRELNAAVARTGRTGPLPNPARRADPFPFEDSLTSETAQADFMIRLMPETHEAYLRQRAARLRSRRSDPTAQGALDFVIQNFQYRYVTVFDYLQTYSRGATRKVDLLVAHLVDYDWWLAKGATTPTPLRDQVAVMSGIARLTGGRVHFFAPFDPLREVVSKIQGGDSSLRLAQEAVRRHGAIGVKMYPPMGFAAWGNASLSVWRGRDWLPDIVRRPDFGRLLDEALRELYVWCKDEQVPIMAHSNSSNGPAPEFEQLALARHWRNALDQFDRDGVEAKSLRVNFGHFGNSELVSGGAERAEEFVRLMNATSGSQGARAYADASYFTDALNQQDALVKELKSLYQMSDGVLAKKLMYGSDWEMSLVQRNVDSYIEGFESVFDKLRAELLSHGTRWASLTDDFFGVNAVDYLGLRKGERNRARLEAFHDGRVSEIAWMKKVDALA